MPKKHSLVIMELLGNFYITIILPLQQLQIYTLRYFFALEEDENWVVSGFVINCISSEGAVSGNTIARRNRNHMHIEIEKEVSLFQITKFRFNYTSLYSKEFSAYF